VTVSISDERSYNHTNGNLLSRWFSEPISSTLKMEAISSPETLVETQRNTRRHIPEDDTLQNHRCENLKSYEVRIVSYVLMYQFLTSNQKSHDHLLVVSECISGNLGSNIKGRTYTEDV
jgi:hypothetical protein